MVAEGREARNPPVQIAFRIAYPGPHSESNDLLASALTEIDVEVRQRPISAHQHQLGHVEASGIERIKLVLTVEVQQPLHRAICRNDASADARLFCLPPQLIPLFVLSAARKSNG